MLVDAVTLGREAAVALARLTDIATRRGSGPVVLKLSMAGALSRYIHHLQETADGEWVWGGSAPAPGAVILCSECQEYAVSRYEGDVYPSCECRPISLVENTRPAV